MTQHDSAHLYLIPGHYHGQAVPGVVGQTEGEGLDPGDAGPGHVEQPQHVPPPAALDLQQLALV